MKSRVRIRKSQTRQLQPEVSTIPGKPMFQSRGFVEPKHQEVHSPPSDLKTQLERSERYGHSLSKMKFTEQPVQRVLDPKKIERSIDIAKLAASEYERLLRWNEEGKLDELKNASEEDAKHKLLRWASKPHPLERPEEESNQDKLPKWMNRYEPFRVSLPNHLGGGALIFHKNANSVVFENRGWISNNKVIKFEGDKQSYMLHLILEWKNENQPEPNAHITIRKLEAQRNIILDKIAPQSGKKRSQGLEASASSLSVGTGDNERKQGHALGLPEQHEEKLRSEETVKWLKEKVIEEVKRAEIVK